jgi:hypothetical protein
MISDHPGPLASGNSGQIERGLRTVPIARESEPIGIFGGFGEDAVDRRQDGVAQLLHWASGLDVGQRLEPGEDPVPGTVPLPSSEQVVTAPRTVLGGHVSPRHTGPARNRMPSISSRPDQTGGRPAFGGGRDEAARVAETGVRCV